MKPLRAAPKYQFNSDLRSAGFILNTKNYDYRDVFFVKTVG
ncbi:hypothetical protein VSVS05_00239 [Vibrio scophthalmi]|uniref:Uncharacterized protein n=1 Tax=Vibrio scophthalmi TaxID=45658 RepID=A0A1C7F7K7_9VIBR|nr:hypothetical protein VSVS05_00239 [Vibrio scophthalmi]